MRCLIERIDQLHSPEALFAQLAGEPGIIVLRSSVLDRPEGRFSFVLARPFLRFRSVGSRCDLSWFGGTDTQYGDPWRRIESLVARYEVMDHIDMPFPLGGCFGYWGYELNNFVEPRLTRKASNDLDVPDCQVGFYDSLVVFDHQLGTTWVIATGLDQSGARDSGRAAGQLKFWLDRLSASSTQHHPPEISQTGGICEGVAALPKSFPVEPTESGWVNEHGVVSNVSRSGFLELVCRAQAYIRAGDIYQVNLSHRLSAPCPYPGPAFFRSLSGVSPAPFSAYMDAGDFELVSSSPELFLRMSGAQIRTRPIKGTRPRGTDPAQDSQFSYQLQTSPKEMAELVMITDLLRNDLGRVCEFGSVHVPELARLERFAQVQHLISTVEGSLRQEVTHLGALAACFPGGSITGAPKIRAMEIIDELEPSARGPYTGALGYLGFNRESQLAMTIRTMLLKDGLAHFPVGAGIVADSNPEAEYAETLAKARGFIEALHVCLNLHDCFPQRQIRS